MARYIENSYVNDERAGAERCSPSFIEASVSAIVRTILERPKDRDELRDPSPYTGLSGIAFALTKVRSYPGGDLKAEAQKMIERCRSLFEEKPDKQARYLCGGLGAMTIDLTVQRDKSIEKHIHSLVRAIIGPAFPCDEVLYGRAGFLAAALWLKITYNEEVINPDDIKRVIDEIIHRGREDRSSDSNPPLMWEWHDTAYLGAAHGVAGILHLCLSFAQLLDPDSRRDLIKTAEWLIGVQDSTGNFPSSRKWVGKSKEEPLVHWCHGATGVVPLLITLRGLEQKELYLKALLKAGELIWREGLLKKGPGLCHGVSGSAYALLNIWRLTGDEKWLNRAKSFAVLMMDDTIRSQQRTPDSPYSLFEGWAGALCFLVDLQQPDQAQFPLFPILFK
ncbi:unnamed protein product, partial [Mesorhabditis belari]|uniref:Uncharacterized protein n=1 Tax=Mesorhabditis belari TaxID=2138241 RepID=A0AAF3EZG3_9BILA